MSNEAFYYVDGIPTKGVWIDLEMLFESDPEGSILEELAVHGFVRRTLDGDPVYGGDLLVADVEGPLATACYTSSTGQLDLELFFRLYNSDIDEHVVEAFFHIFGTDFLEVDYIREAYVGQYRSDADFAAEYTESLGELDHNSFIASYIDYEKMGRDMMMDYSSHHGHYFRNCW